MELFLSVIAVLIVGVAVCNTLYSHFYKVVNMPSAPATRQAIVDDIRALYGEAEGMVIYDLGSGWGGLSFKLANAFPEATIIGIEISPVPFAISKLSCFIRGLKNLSFHRADLFKQDWNNANIVACYLSPYHMDRLQSVLTDKQLTVYSQGFPMTNHTAAAQWDIPMSIERKLYRYDMACG